MKSFFMLGALAISFIISFFAVGGEDVSEEVLAESGSASVTESADEAEGIRVTSGEETYIIASLFVEDELYVDLSEYCEMSLSAAVEEEKGVFLCRTGDVTVEAASGKEYLSVNGVYYWCPLGNVKVEDRLFVPLSVLAAALGETVTESREGEFLVVGKGRIPSAEESYNDEDVFWLSRIIGAEAGGEFFRGKIAVGNVVLNRVRSKEFPDSIYEVIFDIRFGVQFSPVASGSVYRTPGEESVIAAKLCLTGAEIDRDMLYFYNPRKSDSTWMVENCTFVASIGNHDFFS